ncbi:MAG: SxtJ family membrane protein [Pseudomonadota bacterium]
MSELKSNTTVEVGSERGFGLVFAVVFLIVALWPLFHGASPRVWAFAIAAAFAVLAFAFPRSLAVPNRLWHKFGLLLGAIVAPIVMALVYLTTFIPIGIALALFKKDLLRLKLDPECETYWIERKDPPQSMKNQF